MSEAFRNRVRHGVGAGALLLAAIGTGGTVPLGAQPGRSPSAPRPAVEAFDHLVLAVPDLEPAIEALAERTGVRATIGGSHPGRGTRNALLSLGTGYYLEIIAPDPAQPESKTGEPAQMAELAQPVLGGWALRSDDLAAELARVRANGLEVAGPFPGGRDRPDGVKLTWQTAFVSGPLASSMPFLIEWGSGTPHPSLDAPLLGTLQSLVVVDPDPDSARKALAALGVDCVVVRGDTVALRATIATQRGPLEL